MYIQSVQDHISHHFIKKTWNRASHWFNEHTVKCRRWTCPCLTDGKIRTAGCFPGKWRNVAECGLFHKPVGFQKFEKWMEGRLGRTYQAFHPNIVSVKISQHSWFLLLTKWLWRLKCPTKIRTSRQFIDWTLENFSTGSSPGKFG